MPKRARAVRVGIRGYGNAKAVACFLPGGRQDGPSGLGPLTRLRIYPACAFRVRAAFFAEADLCAGLRLRAAARARLKSASLDAAAPLSRLSAFSVACERFGDGLAPFSAFLRSCFAFFRVSSGYAAFFRNRQFHASPPCLRKANWQLPALVERAPCSRLRIDSISSRTNSAAWVEADFPSRLSRCARSMLSLFGMMLLRLFSLTTRQTRV